MPDGSSCLSCPRLKTSSRVGVEILVPTSKCPACTLYLHWFGMHSIDAAAFDLLCRWIPLVRIGIPKVDLNGKASAMDMQLMGARLDYFHAPTSSWKDAVEDSELSVSLCTSSLQAFMHSCLASGCKRLATPMTSD